MIGIIRNLDDLGRVTIPKEYRRYLGIGEKAAVEIKVNENDEIVITKPKEKERD